MPEVPSMQAYEELFGLAKTLREAAVPVDADDIALPLDALENAVNQVKRSFSGSWLGYHSRVYYAGLQPAPPRANFSQEWGLKDMHITSLGSRGDSQEFDPEDIKAYIYELAEKPDLEPARQAATKAVTLFNEAKSEVMSILENELGERQDAFLTKLKEELDHLEPMSKAEIAQRWSPKGQIMTRDMIALGQNNAAPAYGRAFRRCLNSSLIWHLQSRR